MDSYGLPDLILPHKVSAEIPPPPKEIPAPQFLWTRTDDTVAYYWSCQECPGIGPAGHWYPAAAAGHVTRTGHAVEIIRTHVVTIEGVRY